MYILCDVAEYIGLIVGNFLIVLKAMWFPFPWFPGNRINRCTRYAAAFERLPVDNGMKTERLPSFLTSATPAVCAGFDLS